MTYKYYSQDGTELFFSSFIDAVKDARVYFVESINTVKAQFYYRSGSGWKPTKKGPLRVQANLFKSW